MTAKDIFLFLQKEIDKIDELNEKTNKTVADEVHLENRLYLLENCVSNIAKILEE